MMQQPLRAEDLRRERALARATGRSACWSSASAPTPTRSSSICGPRSGRRTRARVAGARDEFRRAISHAVDREAYANTVFLGAAVPVHGPVTPGNKAVVLAGPAALSRTRGETASSLLAGLGWPIATPTRGSRTRRHRGALHRAHLPGQHRARARRAGAAGALEAVGIAVDVVPLEQGALIERMLAGNFDAIFFNYVAPTSIRRCRGTSGSAPASAHIWNIGQKTPATDWEREIDRLIEPAGGDGRSGGARSGCSARCSASSRAPAGPVLRRAAAVHGRQRARPQPDAGGDAAAAAVERRNHHAAGPAAR